MALCRTVTKRLLKGGSNLGYASAPITSRLVHSPIPSPKPHCHCDFIASPDSAINNLSLPVGKKLREKLMSITTPHLDELCPPPPAIGAAEAKKVLRVAQMEEIREKLRNIPATTIPYGDFVGICIDACGNRETGIDFAKALDQSGNVIVLGGVVFLHPRQVAKSMERVLWESIGMPKDPRRKELDRLEKQKRGIDEKARSIVRGELYCGLGFLVVQTLGFMRLTFWELTWDVMEPICFFVASLHFAAAYLFFLTTSKEPSFQAYFHTRFTVKQNKLIKTHKFDIKRYNQLRQAFFLSQGPTVDPLPMYSTK